MIPIPAQATMTRDKLQPHDAGTSIAGTPQISWLTETMDDIWNDLRKQKPPKYAIIMNHNNDNHDTAIREHAQFIIDEITQ